MNKVKAICILAVVLGLQAVSALALPPPETKTPCQGGLQLTCINYGGGHRVCFIEPCNH
jgi:hypothetical protein